MTSKGTDPSQGPPEDEARAIAACQRGDRQAYELIVKRYAARAVSVARSILRDGVLAEDISQEAFIRAYRAIARFDLNQGFYPWFYRILKNCCLSALKRRRTGMLSLDAENAPAVAAPTNDPSTAASRHELRERIDLAMAQLSAPHREILHLSHFDGLAYKEIADCLSIPIGTVMSRLHAARRALRKVLGPMMAEGETGAKA